MKKINNDGFTLVELVVGIVLIGIFVGTISVLQSNTSKIGEKAQDITVANAFAENKLESLRSQGYLAIEPGNYDITSELPNELAAPRSGGLTISTNTASTKKVEISLSYNDQGEQRNYIYTSYIGELGVGQN